jgi:glycosyltransferase involved in cell wall biosynthesis
VVRYLSAALPRAGWEVRLATGSLGRPGLQTNAATFFGRDDIAVADYSDAVAAFERGDDPMAADVPMHPSYEDRAGVPDRWFAAVAPDVAERQVRAWSDVLAPAWDDVELFHLQHLTPIHDAVAALWPDRPVVTHLHGTELKMLERLEAPTGPPLDHREFWVARLRAAADRTSRFICISPHDAELAQRLLGAAADTVEVIPNGVDTRVFDRRTIGPDERLDLWRGWLVDDPRGWDETGRPGTLRYREKDLAAFVDPDTGEISPVLLFVGRFLDFKRVPLLVRAYARARPRFARRAPLVIWGGSPGEWEGEHPHTVAEEEGVDDVFFVGWRGHDELPTGLSCASVMAAPSFEEPFGQVFLEAMACEVPVITTATGGPVSFVNTQPGRPNGWLVPPDDLEALADALAEAVNRDEIRNERSVNAYEQIRARYSWEALAGRFAEVYLQALEGR